MVDLALLGDAARLQALANSGLMDSGAEEVFDRLTRLASRLLDVPIALMTLLDEERQVAKSVVGELVPVAQSYCRYVVGSGAPFVVEDVREDDRVTESAPLQDAGLIACCGVPLTDSAGHTIGTLCTMDGRPRQWSPSDVAALRDLAASAMSEIELRVANQRLRDHEDEMRAQRAREAQLASVVEAADEAINLVDLEGRVTGWNPACERLYGWPAEEVLGRRLTEIGLLVGETDEQADFSLDARGLAGESVAALWVRRRRRDGRLIYVDLSITPLCDPTGTIVGVTAVARDVTDRHQLQSELLASETRFRHIFDHATTGITLITPDRTLIDANARFCAITGYTREQLLGRTLEWITHPEDRDADLGGAASMLTDPASHYETEKRYCHRDGRTVRVRLSASLVRDDSGAPLYFIAHTEDVTAARAAETALIESRELLDGSQSVAHVGSWSFDLETGTIAWSREQYRLHGLEPGACVPSVDQLITFVVAEDREVVRSTLASLLARPRAFAGEYRVRSPDGGIRTLWTSAEVQPADPVSGRPARVLGATHDVTVQREAQAAQRAVEQRHRRLLENLPDTMVILYDTEMRAVLMQGGLLGEAGIDPESFLGTPLADHITNEQGRILPGLVARALNGESVTIDHDTGRGRQFQIEFAPYFGDGEEIVGALTVWRDITARMARENEHRMLATMVEQSEDAIVAKDRDGRITEWSGAAEQMYGYPREEAVGQLLRELVIPPELHQADIDAHAHVLAGGTLQADTRRVRRDGSPLHVSISISPLRAADGEIVGTTVIARDISDRIAEQAARREIEDRLRITVEHAPIGVALVDLRGGPHGSLLSVNASFAALLGDEDPVAGGMSLTSAMHPDDVPALRADLALLASDDAARTESEVRCLHSDGRIMWLLVTGAAVPSESGAPHLAVLHALDIGERKRFEGQLQHLADHDPLTGLFNRRRFEAELTRTIAYVDRYGHESALLMIDLDGFKGVNDTMGHSYGDELLTRIAATLRETLRETDVIGRLGGDEFAIILHSVSPPEAATVGEKLLQVINEHGVVVSDHRHGSVTASIGIAPIDDTRRVDAEGLLAEADLAMYSAKESGRNQVCFAGHGPGVRRSTVAQRSWLTRLRTALENDGFELFAQPIHGICAPDVPRYELLLRMRGEDGELLAPAAFLHNAERFDLIQEIDRWVFRHALELLAECREAGNDVSLSVNMSGRTLNDPTLIDDLATMLHERPVPRDRLVVEVTETVAIVNIQRARQVAHALRELGCRFALDDFGAGFASFYYLKHLEFDYVKIDGEFVKSLGENPTDLLVIRSVVDIARGLGAETIAEFVGDDAAVEQLRALGVDYGQGYHLGRPAPVSEVLPLRSVSAT